MKFLQNNKETHSSASIDRFLVLTELSLSARRLLEQAWTCETAFQNITILADDAPSRGQCGVSSLWLSRLLVDRGFDAVFTEGKISIPNDMSDEHVWVEVCDEEQKPLVVDLTSDQYKTVWGSPVHIGEYENGRTITGGYTPERRFHPYDVPRKKLLGRLALLEESITELKTRRNYLCLITLSSIASTPY